MPDRETVNFNGRPVQAVRVNINHSEEPFSVYSLDDGTILKRKLVTVDVLRLEGQYDGNREPIYMVKGKVVDDVRALPEMKGP